MAAKKSAPARGGRPAPKKAAAPKKPTRDFGGFDSAMAQKQAAIAYFGKESNITRVKQSTIVDWLSSQGLNQGQPVGLNKQRFYLEGDKLTTSGERTDLRGGAAYNAPDQQYLKGYGPQAGKNGKTGGRKRKQGPEGALGLGYAGGMGGPSEAANAPSYLDRGYAEADVTQTSMLRAQGKAYAAGRQGMGGVQYGQTTGPAEAPIGESASEAGGATGGGRKRKGMSSKQKGRVTKAKKAGQYKKAQAIRSRSRKK